MNCRRHGSKSSIALWMLIAIADLAILVAAIGATTTLLILASLVALAGGVIAARGLMASGNTAAGNMAARNGAGASTGFGAAVRNAGFTLATARNATRPNNAKAVARRRA